MMTLGSSATTGGGGTDWLGATMTDGRLGSVGLRGRGW
jgi:hypothetical protein